MITGYSNQFFRKTVIIMSGDRYTFPGRIIGRGSENNPQNHSKMIWPFHNLILSHTTSSDRDL